MEDLKNIAPKLSKIRKENPFGVPHSYFDDLNARLQARIREESRGVRRNPVIRILKPALAIAASFAIIFVLVYWPLSNSSPNQTAQNNVQTTPTVSDSSDNILLSVIGDIDDNLLMAFEENEANSTQPAVSDTVVESYLSDNLSDYDIAQYMASAQLNP